MPNQTRRKQRGGVGLMNRLRAYLSGNRKKAKQNAYSRISQIVSNTQQKKMKTHARVANLGISLENRNKDQVGKYRPTEKREIERKAAEEIAAILREYPQAGLTEEEVTLGIDEFLRNPQEFLNELEKANQQIQELRQQVNSARTEVNKKQTIEALSRVGSRAFTLLRIGAAVYLFYQGGWFVYLVALGLNAATPGATTAWATPAVHSFFKKILGNPRTLLLKSNRELLQERLQMAKTMNTEGRVPGNYGFVNSASYNFNAAAQRARNAEEARLNAEYRAAAAAVAKNTALSFYPKQTKTRKNQGRFFPTGMQL